MAFLLQLQAMYCDDVRQETGNKLSFMGVYRGRLIVQSFPAVLPKLNIVLNATVSSDYQFNNARCVVLRNGEVLTEIKLPDHRGQHEGWSSEDCEMKEGSSSIQRIVTVQVIMGVHNLKLDAPCVLQSRMYIGDDDELKGQALKIEAVEYG